MDTTKTLNGKLYAAIMGCYIAQMRRELHNFEYELEQIEQLLADEKYTACYSTNAVGLKYSVKELREVRKYFNRALRGLLGELEDSGLLGESDEDNAE